MFRRVSLLFAALAILACNAPERPPATVRPRRVVTLAPNLTEVVYALGAGGTLVGTDDYSDDPPAAKALPKVGGVQPNVEKIVALRPDVVFATTTGSTPALGKALAAAQIPLVLLRHERLSDIRTAIITIGKRLGVGDATELADRVDRAFQSQRRTRSKRPRVMFVVWTDPMYVAGRDTFADDYFALAGADNAVPPSVTGWPQYSLESFIANPPDLLLYPSRSVTRAQVDALLARAHVACAVAPIDENRFTRLGPRAPEALRMLNEELERWARAH